MAPLPLTRTKFLWIEAQLRNYGCSTVERRVSPLPTEDKTPSGLALEPN